MTQPGRDRWPRAVSLLFSGGGIPGGQIVGATDRIGADVTRRRVGVRDLLATLYRHLGIDAGSITLRDRTGRPVPALPEGRPIAELTAPLPQWGSTPAPGFVTPPVGPIGSTSGIRSGGGSDRS
jgi:hypothetical protein